VALRRQRLTGPVIARRLDRPVSTIGRVLRRHQLGRLSALTPKPEIIRYQRDRPGELIHIDIKKLGRIEGIGHRINGDRRTRSRGAGWEFVHVAVDDASRLAYTELLPNERKESAVGFTARAIDWFARHGAPVERVMTDNGSAYLSRAFRDLLSERGITHKRTRPYTPRTNGKAERFIQTSLREWAYAQPFTTSAERAAAMQPWIDIYNGTRPHSALGAKSPLSWIAALKIDTTTPLAKSDPEPGFVGAGAVKPREATAEGGLGLTALTPTQAQSETGGDNLLANDS
jgi:transposase InsO family protein